MNGSCLCGTGTHILTNFPSSTNTTQYMESQLWRRFRRSETQVDLTLRLGFPNGNGGEFGHPDDHNEPLFSPPLHQTHQVAAVNNNVGLASCGGMSEANYNPNQILWSKELKTYVLKSNNLGQGHHQQTSFGSHDQVKGTGNGSSTNNLANDNDLYTLLNPASRTADDHEAETSSGGRRRASRRRRVSHDEAERRCTNYNCNTNFTPMWRKGPLGPKSLCNACGIRYRKEMMNREAMTTENSQS